MKKEITPSEVEKTWKAFSKWFLFSVLAVYILYLSMTLILKYTTGNSLALPLNILIVGLAITLFVAFLLSKTKFDYEKILRIIMYSFFAIITIICLFNCRINHIIFLLYIPVVLFMRLVSNFKNTVIITICIVFLFSSMKNVALYYNLGKDVSYYEGRESFLELLHLIIISISCYFSLLILYFYGKLSNAYSHINIVNFENDNIVTIKETKDILKHQDLSLIDNEKYKTLYLEILNLLENKKIYRDPELTIKKLAEILESNTTYVSNAIKLNGNSKFNQIINNYRMKDVLTDLDNKKHKHYTLEHIYTEAGFSQQPTFNRIFKDHTGKTPREYIDYKQK